MRTMSVVEAGQRALFMLRFNNILGTRAASSPPILLDSSGSSDSQATATERENETGKLFIGE